jgi:hypothetical protein
VKYPLEVWASILVQLTMVVLIFRHTYLGMFGALVLLLALACGGATLIDKNHRQVLFMTASTLYVIAFYASVLK